MQRIAVLLSILFLFAFVSPAAAQDRSYHANRFDVDIVVEESGSLLVTETIEFEFQGGPYTFVFRELEGGLTDGVAYISTNVDGDPFFVGTEPGEVEVDRDDGDMRIQWHLEPTSDAIRTFTLTYRMFGVVRQGETADLLIYQPLPDEFEYTIDSSTITFSYSPTAELIGDVVVETGNAQVTQTDNQIVLTAQNLGSDETIVMEAPFALGSLITAPPEWQVRQQAQAVYTPLWIGLGAAIALFGGLFLFSQWNQLRRDKPKLMTDKYKPPSDLSPALAGALNGQNAEAKWSNALATLFDFAKRGIVLIEERPSDSWFKKREFVIVRQHQMRQSALRPHETVLLEILFEDDLATELTFTELQKRLTSKQWKRYKETLQEELETAGYIDDTRRQQKKRISIMGIVTTTLSILTLPFVIGGLVNSWFFAVPGAFFVIGMIGLGIASEQSLLSEEGAVVAAEWQQFANYLTRVAAGKESDEDVDFFSNFLPYAASYGLTNSWAEWYKKEGWVDIPAYFTAVPTQGSAGNEAFIAMLVAGNASGGSSAGGSAGGLAVARPVAEPAAQASTVQQKLANGYYVNFAGLSSIALRSKT